MWNTFYRYGLFQSISLLMFPYILDTWDGVEVHDMLTGNLNTERQDTTYLMFRLPVNTPL